ncbi:MAG: anti-sigma factor antagonist [Ilumatobacteraceae bacterium]|nr:anti-sigma factor antagonist [Ilumatobacteraceae bacterium]
MPVVDGDLVITAGSEPQELVVCGDIDLATVDVLEAAIAAVRSAGHPDLVIDLAGVGFVDSRGLRALLTAQQTGPVSLRRPSIAVRRLLQLTGVEQHFAVID